LTIAKAGGQPVCGIKPRLGVRSAWRMDQVSPAAGGRASSRRVSCPGIGMPARGVVASEREITMKTYWARENRSPPYKGPFTAAEVRDAIKLGELSPDCEVLEATGQTRDALIKATAWRSLPVDLKKLAEGALPLQGTTGSSSEVREFPALRMIAFGIQYVVVAIAFLFGLIGVVAGLLLSQGVLAIVAAIWTILVPLFLWATAELIEVFLQIERNTRKADLTSGKPRSVDKLG
jgi:hypothetical protein